MKSMTKRCRAFSERGLYERTILYELIENHAEFISIELSNSIQLKKRLLGERETRRTPEKLLSV